MEGAGLTDNDVIRMHEVGLFLPNVTDVTFAKNDGLTDKCLPSLEALLSTWPKLECFYADDTNITELCRYKTSWKSKYPTLFRVLDHDPAQDVCDYITLATCTLRSIESVHPTTPTDMMKRIKELFRMENAGLVLSAREIEWNVHGKTFNDLLKEVKQKLTACKAEYRTMLEDEQAQLTDSNDSDNLISVPAKNCHPHDLNDPNWTYWYCDHQCSIVRHFEEDFIIIKMGGKQKKVRMSELILKKREPSKAKTHYCSVCNKEGYLLAEDGWTCEDCLVAPILTATVDTPTVSNILIHNGDGKLAMVSSYKRDIGKLTVKKHMAKHIFPVVFVHETLALSMQDVLSVSPEMQSYYASNGFVESKKEPGNWYCKSAQSGCSIPKSTIKGLHRGIVIGIGNDFKWKFIGSGYQRYDHKFYTAWFVNEHGDIIRCDSARDFSKLKEAQIFPLYHLIDQSGDSIWVSKIDMEMGKPNNTVYHQDGDIPKDKQMSLETRAELERKRKERRSKKKVDAPPTPAMSPTSKSKEVTTIAELQPMNVDKERCQQIIIEEKRAQQKPCPQCGHLNERTMNNNRIHCGGCNTQFCFLCLTCVKGNKELTHEKAVHFGFKCPQHGGDVVAPTAMALNKLPNDVSSKLTTESVAAMSVETRMIEIGEKSGHARERQIERGLTELDIQKTKKYGEESESVDASGKASIKIVYKKNDKTIGKMFANEQGTIVKSVM